jgi:hypothetical protein
MARRGALLGGLEAVNDRAAGAVAVSQRRSWVRALAAVLAVLVALAADALFTANRMQGNPFSLWLSHYSSSQFELAPYSAVREILAYDAFESELREQGNGFSIVIQGFDAVQLDNRLDSLLRSNTLHDSLALGLFSMRFGRPMLEAFEAGNGRLLMHLARATNAVLDAAEEFNIPPRMMAFNDHAVAERTEFLLLFLAKLMTLGEMPELQVRLRRHIAHNAELLVDDSRFTWETNHGLMQIRALLRLAEAVPRSEVGRRSLAVAMQRIGEMLPFLVAEDGAVLEAASGYWLLIHKEWNYIAQRRILPAHIRATIEARLARTAGFLEALVNCEGFLQGLGDSYNRRMTGGDLRFAGSPSRVFSYSSGLAGLEYPYRNSCAQVLFVSLDTPPNVHKMPEDLAVYVFIGAPYFVNAGAYAYDNSPARRYVLSAESQSTVEWKDGRPAWSSRLSKPTFDGKKWVFEGEKYSNSGRILRSVSFVPSTGLLEIVDRSDRELSSRLNIHPEVTVHEVNERELLLQGAVNHLRLTHDGTRTWNERWIATGGFKKTPIRQLEISGNPVTIAMQLPAVEALSPPSKTLAMQYPERQQLAKTLSQKYRFSSLARSESAARYVKVMILFAAAIIVAGLLTTSVVPIAGWLPLAITAIFLVADTVYQGFATTWLLNALRGGAP